MCINGCEWYGMAWNGIRDDIELYAIFLNGWRLVWVGMSDGMVWDCLGIVWGWYGMGWGWYEMLWDGMEWNGLGWG